MIKFNIFFLYKFFNGKHFPLSSDCITNFKKCVKFDVSCLNLYKQALQFTKYCIFRKKKTLMLEFDRNLIYKLIKMPIRFFFNAKFAGSVKSQEKVFKICKINPFFFKFRASFDQKNTYIHVKEFTTMDI